MRRKWRRWHFGWRKEKGRRITTRWGWGFSGGECAGKRGQAATREGGKATAVCAPLVDAGLARPQRAQGGSDAGVGGRRRHWASAGPAAHKKKRRERKGLGQL